MTTEQNFPYQAWTLTPSMKPVEKTIITACGAWGFYREWHKSESGARYHKDKDLFPSREAALREGWRRLEQMEARMKKLAASIEKKRATLAKEDSTND